MTSRLVTVAGAGPSGAAAAIAARQSEALVELWDPSRLPRHRVCGEFLSAEAEALLRRLGVWDQFLAQRPARYSHLRLHFPGSERSCRLPEAGFGLSRYRFDSVLEDRAVGIGVDRIYERISEPTIVATGRQGRAPVGNRLFGFKAHYRGPVSDGVDLYFFGRFYVGVSTVEDGITNVCGLGPEPELRAVGFEPDGLMAGFAPLSDRLRPLSRAMGWLVTGPLVFQNRTAEETTVYRAGDALAFVDPFTGTGLVNSLMSGTLAGECAARGVAVAEYQRRIRRSMGGLLRWSSIYRWALLNGWAEALSGWLRPEWLVSWTRPRV